MNIWIDDDYSDILVCAILKDTLKGIEEVKAKNDYLFEQDRLDDEELYAAIKVCLKYYDTPSSVQITPSED